VKHILVFTTLVLAALVAKAEPVEVKPPAQKILATPSGRFVYGQVSDFRGDQFLLDTQTGRLWQMVVDKEGQKKLQPVPIIQILGDEAYIPDTQQEAESHKAFVRKQALDQYNKK
jgi:hypothetical protein